jgi:hypothetical protein
MATDPRLEATAHQATLHRHASLGIDVEGFAYDQARHSNGTTLVIKGVTAEDLRGLAADLLEQAELLEPAKPAERQKTQCPFCSHVVGVTKAGRIVVHKRTRTALQDGSRRVFRVECVGSRTEAVEG